MENGDLYKHGVSHIPGTSGKPVIRVVLADDHPIVRDGRRKLLLLEDDIQVVGEASDGREVLQVVDETRPDILILDRRMPNMDGLSALQAMQQFEPKPKVIVLT